MFITCYPSADQHLSPEHPSGGMNLRRVRTRLKKSRGRPEHTRVLDTWEQQCLMEENQCKILKGFRNKAQLCWLGGQLYLNRFYVPHALDFAQTRQSLVLRDVSHANGLILSFMDLFSELWHVGALDGVSVKSPKHVKSTLKTRRLREEKFIMS